MDPFESFSPDVHYLVFQHFDFKDILEISTVSKLWNELTGSSSCCMKKVKLSLKFWKKSVGTKQEQTEEKVKIIQSTTRCYRNISIDCRFDKYLSLELWKLLKLSELSLTELKIKSIKLDSLTSLTLPNLEVLKLTYVPKSVRNVLLTSSGSLTKLKIKMESPFKWSEAPRPDQESLACIRDCLQRNCMLKDLELHGSTQYNSFFDEDFSEVVRFQLTSLKVKTSMRLALVSEQNEKNFIQFLATQSTCLKKVFIDVCRPNVIEHVFIKMPCLTSIHLDVMIMNSHAMRDLKLGLNERIRDLKIPYVNQHADIEEFLAVVPNLELLFVSHLSHETMEFIARNLLSLKSLKFRYDEIDCEGFYEQLKDDFPEVNQNIEMIVDYDYT